MEKEILNELEPLEEFDIKVQYCDSGDCLHDCPPDASGNCNYFLSQDF